ncbi:MAG: DUF269 domain-containing protein [Spirulinaceae cyanobacterium]
MPVIASPEKQLTPSYSQHPFLQELVAKIRGADTELKYYNWSDESLIGCFISTPQKRLEPFKVSSLYRLFIHAFYHTIGAAIARATGHKTETFVHLKGKKLSSVVIFCGGVLVLHSWIWESDRFEFQSCQHLIKASENQIGCAIAKANHYLDFVE